ncbi:FtsK/SpoIIIE family protein [Tenacibaculum sp. MAR_2009_124]|uniref:DNA translocase FtsK n=1 Tax=Tenacibaculum sp. MAR_2009_124 TaxID=1250059 RepID=UPI00089AC74D|nr:DNA translocase FtsK [Tenacibaculum sp. MAR_2009_124]SED09473.1 FtsK/SpoIIIE family protein [Tenacibaculum sp. MAR_2009_124]
MIAEDRKVHQFKGLSTDQYEELFSNYLINSWSYSKVNTFSRNEKAFEMQYLYNETTKRSSSTIAGNAYHEALEFYFTNLKVGLIKDIVELQEVAYQYIKEVPSNEWKLQKTTPTIEQCISQASKNATSLLANFISEKNVYEFDEILHVEPYLKEFININGVDIPLPCHLKIDLVVKKDGKIIIIDHKSKNKFSDEKEIALSSGKQAITYAKGLESIINEKVDEVWFIENKYSKNRNGNNQLACFKIELNEDTRALYEALLYEPLKRMIDAVSNPDYVYLLNDSDNFVDKAEIHAFWSRTMIAEVDDFNIPESKKEIIEKRLKKIRDTSINNISPVAIKKFKKNASEFIQFNLNDKDMTNEDKIEHVLRTLNVIVKVNTKLEGYSSDTYLLEASSGTNLGSIHKYKLDLAHALNVPSIMIKKELVIHNEQSFLAIEAPKKRKDLLEFDLKHLQDKKIPIGVNNFKEVVFWDLENQSTPHALICGATGSGKSVCLDSTLEYALASGIDDVVIFDPKYEFEKYENNPNISVYSDIDDIESMMELLVDEMNRYVRSHKKNLRLVIFDEFADAVASSKKGKDLKVYDLQVIGHYKDGREKTKLVHVDTKKSLEENLKILLQKGRSTGLRIAAATQRASVKVISGDAKVNFPVQICFRVPKEIDSNVVLGEPGAETLTGKGDGLINSPEYTDLVRFQGFYKK